MGLYPRFSLRHGNVGKEAIAAYGVGLRIEQIILLPNIGLNVATLTLVAQNSGAKLFDRAQEALTKALTYGGILSTTGTLIVFIFAKYLMVAFTDDASVISIGTTYLRIDALVLYAYVVIFVNIAALQGLKKPEFGMVIGVCRLIVAPIIVFYLFTEILHFELLALWWGFFFITWSAAAVAFFYTQRRLTIDN